SPGPDGAGGGKLRGGPGLGRADCGTVLQRPAGGNQWSAGGGQRRTRNRLRATEGGPANRRVRQGRGPEAAGTGREPAGPGGGTGPTGTPLSVRGRNESGWPVLLGGGAVVSSNGYSGESKAASRTARPAGIRVVLSLAALPGEGSHPERAPP